MKHTPGPWQIMTTPKGNLGIHHNTGNYQRNICTTPYIPAQLLHPEDAANAALIAAAPDMLEALELVMETYCLYIDFTRETEQMRKARTLVGYAIDKATKG
mgnify:CR=1 FL=1